MLVEQIEKGNPEVEIAYTRGVKPEGNVKALELMSNVFDVTSASLARYRDYPGQRLKLKDKYARFDADKVFNIDTPPAKEAPAAVAARYCAGSLSHRNASYSATICVPENPIGPAWYPPRAPAPPTTSMETSMSEQDIAGPRQRKQTQPRPHR